MKRLLFSQRYREYLNVMYMYNTNKKNYPTQMKFIKQSPEWNEQNTDKIIQCQWAIIQLK